MLPASNSPSNLPHLSYLDLDRLLERAELSASVRHRRHTLLALCDLAAKAKGAHDPGSRWRLKRFCAALEAMEGNDEVEVTGEMLCETVILAMSALEPR